ncbi:hypothetical protein GWO13_00675 [Candidatus Bathyarchaeota archaeon]|nr:hypothetical protein [Candidatus Bathyarchaeota archaeon]
MPSTKTLTTRYNSEFSKIDKYTIPLSNSLALRIYSDTKPYNWKAADLQKGLIFVYKKVETVGEGTGFGVPVLIYSDETRFSGSSNVHISRQNSFTLIRKEFFMDKITRNKFRNVKLENRKLRAIFRYMAELYQKHKHLRFLALKNIFMKMGVHTSFVKTVSAGKVIVTYGIRQGRVLVKADFTRLKRENLQKIFMLNEQGARFFRRYLDSNGTKLANDKIGAWDAIEVEWASITDLQGTVGFRLERIKNSVLRRGREFLEGCLDWVGLNYEINPENAVFGYEIEILGA